jgi:hypothetical protein
VEKKVDAVQKDVNDLQKKVNELLKKVDARWFVDVGEEAQLGLGRD